MAYLIVPMPLDMAEEEAEEHDGIWVAHRPDAEMQTQLLFGRSAGALVATDGTEGGQTLREEYREDPIEEDAESYEETYDEEYDKDDLVVEGEPPL